MCPVSRRVGASGRGPLTPWRFVLQFGLVSLFTDMVYEGARSIIGPVPGDAGASAALVGLVVELATSSGTGCGWRPGTSGPQPALLGVDHHRVRHDRAQCAVHRRLPCTRTGAAVVMARSGSARRCAPLPRTPCSRTRRPAPGVAAGFGVHQAMDQSGAMVGPLLLAAVLEASGGSYRLAFAVLAVPGVVVLGLLVCVAGQGSRPGPVRTRYRGGAGTGRRREGHGRHRAGDRAGLVERRPRPRLPRLMWQYVAAVGVLSVGVAPFPLLALHAQSRGC